MSLTDRLAAAQRSRGAGRPSSRARRGTASRAAQPRQPTPPPTAATPGSVALADATQPRRARDRRPRPVRRLKRIVHQRLVEALGPKLYDAHMTQSELEQQVRVALQTALADTDSPMSSADRTRVSQEIADDILGYGPIEPLLRDPT